MTELLLAPTQGSVAHFIVTTLPLFGLLVYFLYDAWKRPNASIYTLGDDATDDQINAANTEIASMMRLSDMLIVFLVFHFLWTLFAIYVVVFIPKRRHLVGKYLSDGEEVIGDVLYDTNSRTCSQFQDYGYAVYPHPTKKTLIRKRVRVYQPYTREKITILRLPNKPLSGQAKIDIEIDLSAASKDRDNRNKHLAATAVFWFFFTLIGAWYVLHQMRKLDSDMEDHSLSMKVFLVFVGLNIPVAYISNFFRFMLARNWMTNRGAMIDGSDDARELEPGCLMAVESFDGSNAVPYSMMDEEELSYQGSIASHELDPKMMEGAPVKKVWVTL